MPKRKRHHKDYDEIRRKIKKLERDLHRARETRSDDRYSDDRDYRDRYYYYDYSDHSDKDSIRYESENSLDREIYGDLLEYPPLDPEDSAEIVDTHAPVYTHVPNTAPTATPIVAPTVASTVVPTVASIDAPTVSPVTIPNTSSAEDTTITKQTIDSTEATSQKETPIELDSAVLEILGADPADTIEYGKEIRKELASRFEHIATTGLTKEARKELLEKYLVPANCTKIGAPLMNAEIKAAVTEIITKRDKGIELRQKQLACAISGLAGVINKELESNEKDKERLKQLMDVGRILCDVQHSESVTRRNFAIYSIKKDLKDHITHTKVDKYLFGENLAETLKTAKAVTKSGTDLKVKSQVKTARPFTSTSNNLNWKAPAPARRQQGPQRSREPAQPTTSVPAVRNSRAPRQGNSSKISQPPQRQHRRR